MIEMVKRFLLLMAGVAALVGASAQENDGTFRSSMFPKEPIGRWSVGVFGGMDNNTHVVNVGYASDMKYTSMGGTTAGLSAGYHPTGWLTLRGDVAWVQKNYRLDRDSYYVSFVYTESTNNYLLVPVAAEISFGRTFRVAAHMGAYAGYWLTGKRQGQSLSVSYLVSGNEEDTFFDEDYQFDETRDNRFDAGLDFGFGLRMAFAKKIDVSVDMHWYYGLTDVQKNYMTNLNPRYNTTRAIQVGISYWLGKKNRELRTEN